MTVRISPSQYKLYSVLFDQSRPAPIVSLWPLVLVSFIFCSHMHFLTPFRVWFGRHLYAQSGGNFSFHFSTFGEPMKANYVSLEF